MTPTQEESMTPSTFRSTEPRFFPFPLEHAIERPRVDVEPAGILKETAAGSWGGTMFVVDDNYERSLDLRAEILERDPARFTTLPHMMPAQWDAMLYSMKRLAAEHPDVFSLDRHGEFWTWQN